jgi:MYXO-CTERM domain-containing protein
VDGTGEFGGDGAEDSALDGDPKDDASGCACTAAGSRRSAALAALGLLSFALLERRRK